MVVLQDKDVCDDNQDATSHETGGTVDTLSIEWVVPVVDRLALEDDSTQTDTDTCDVDKEEGDDDVSEDQMDLAGSGSFWYETPVKDQE